MSNIALSEEYQLFINGKYKGELKSPEVTLGLIEHDEIKIKEEEGQSYLQALASNMDEKDIVKKYFALQGVYVVSSGFDERGEFGVVVVLPPHLASSALIATTYQKITIESLRLKFKNQAFLVTQPLDAEILGDSLSYAHDHIITQDPDFEFLNNTPYKSSLMDWRVMYWGTVPGAFPEGDVKLMCLNTFYYLCVMMNESYKGPTIKGMLPVHRKPTQREINQLKLRPIYSMQGKAFNTPYAIPIPIPDKILKVMSNFSEIMVRLYFTFSNLYRKEQRLLITPFQVPNNCGQTNNVLSENAMSNHLIPDHLVFCYQNLFCQKHQRKRLH